jgi:hypothetical protein
MTKMAQKKKKTMKTTWTIIKESILTKNLEENGKTQQPAHILTLMICVQGLIKCTENGIKCLKLSLLQRMFILTT